MIITIKWKVEEIHISQLAERLDTIQSDDRSEVRFVMAASKSMHVWIVYSITILRES